MSQGDKDQIIDKINEEPDENNSLGSNTGGFGMSYNA